MEQYICHLSNWLIISKKIFLVWWRPKYRIKIYVLFNHKAFLSTRTLAGLKLKETFLVLLHLLFTHANTTVSLILFKVSRISSLKVQCNVVYACANGIWQLGLMLLRKLKNESMLSSSLVTSLFGWYHAVMHCIVRLQQQVQFITT